jgi:predicted Zn-dependent protease
MIKNSKEPTLWITKLHYPGMKHYQTATMTGVAQHGVFLIENGQVRSPVENIRFEESIPEALKRVEAMSESRLVFDPLSFSLPSGVVVPAMKIKQFRFVGSTKRST